MKNKYTKIVTPVGIAQYPWLSSPDTKFSEVGDYKTNLILSKKWKPYLQRITLIR